MAAGVSRLTNGVFTTLKSLESEQTSFFDKRARGEENEGFFPQSISS